jgi:hypothetical protein
MGKSVKLQQHGENGSYKLTIPKQLVEAKGWEKGDTFDLSDLGSELRYVHD